MGSNRLLSEVPSGSRADHDRDLTFSQDRKVRERDVTASSSRRKHIPEEGGPSRPTKQAAPRSYHAPKLFEGRGLGSSPFPSTRSQTTPVLPKPQIWSVGCGSDQTITKATTLRGLSPRSLSESDSLVTPTLMRHGTVPLSHLMRSSADSSSMRCYSIKQMDRTSIANIFQSSSFELSGNDDRRRYPPSKQPIDRMEMTSDDDQGTVTSTPSQSILEDPILARSQPGDRKRTNTATTRSYIDRHSRHPRTVPSVQAITSSSGSSHSSSYWTPPHSSSPVNRSCSRIGQHRPNSPKQTNEGDIKHYNTNTAGRARQQGGKESHNHSHLRRPSRVQASERRASNETTEPSDSRKAASSNKDPATTRSAQRTGETTMDITSGSNPKLSDPSRLHISISHRPPEVIDMSVSQKENPSVTKLRKQPKQRPLSTRGQGYRNIDNAQDDADGRSISHNNRNTRNSKSDKNALKFPDHAIGPVRNHEVVKNLCALDYYMVVNYRAEVRELCSPQILPVVLRDFKRILSNHPRIVYLKGTYREIISIYFNNTAKFDESNLYLKYYDELAHRYRFIPVFPAMTPMAVIEQRRNKLLQINSSSAAQLTPTPRSIPPTFEVLSLISVLISQSDDIKDIYVSGYRPPKLLGERSTAGGGKDNASLGDGLTPSPRARRKSIIFASGEGADAKVQDQQRPPTYRGIWNNSESILRSGNDARPSSASLSKVHLPVELETGRFYRTDEYDFAFKQLVVDSLVENGASAFLYSDSRSQTLFERLAIHGIRMEKALKRHRDRRSRNGSVTMLQFLKKNFG